MGLMKADLADGGKFEEFVLEIVKKEHPTAERKPGYFPDYDIFVPDSSDTWECKFDRMSMRTGNIAVEFEYNKKPSGIAKSLAKYWVIGYWSKSEENWNTAFIIKEDLLKACDGKKTVKGGDGWKSKMYLLPVEELEQIENIIIHKSQ